MWTSESDKTSMCSPSRRYPISAGMSCGPVSVSLCIETNARINLYFGTEASLDLSYNAF